MNRVRAIEIINEMIDANVNEYRDVKKITNGKNPTYSEAFMPDIMRKLLTANMNARIKELKDLREYVGRKLE